MDGVYLPYVRADKTSFMGANLNEANLMRANLKRAHLIGIRNLEDALNLGDAYFNNTKVSEKEAEIILNNVKRRLVVHRV